MTTETRLDDSGMKDLIVQLKGLVGKVAKVGWNERAKYPDEDGKAGLYVAQVAAINEWGSPINNIPPRSFLRRTISVKRNEWNILWPRYAQEIINGKLSMAVALEGFGLLVKGEIQQTIAHVFEPPLKPATIARRLARYRVKNPYALANKFTKGKILTSEEKRNLGSLTKPLIDTGYMQSSIYNTVENE